MEMKSYLVKIATEVGIAPDLLVFPDCNIEPEKVKVMMIDEAPPKNPDDGFYSLTPKAHFVRTTLGLFKLAGTSFKSIQELINMGIYITTTLKLPRDKSKEAKKPLTAFEIKEHIPILEKEIALFPYLKVIMLMGGTSIKAMNYIVKAQTGKSLIPTEPVYKIRDKIYEWEGKRVFPSSMMGNKNILNDDYGIQRDNTADDIRRMIMLI